MTEIAKDVWLFPYQLKTLGVTIGRNVTVIRLSSGRLVIHSTALFTEADRAQIRELGEPAWLVEGMVDHDTFSAEGHAAFPGIPFLAPDGFQERVGFKVVPLGTPPSEWEGELEVIRIHGIPHMAEDVLFHRPSGTLVVCDLLFNFPELTSMWSKLVMSAVLGRHRAPGFSKRLQMNIEDRGAFCKSIGKVMTLPIKRIIPGHGTVLDTEAKQRAMAIFSKKGFL